VAFKSTYLFCHVDNTFRDMVPWTQRAEELPHNIHPKIQFIMETNSNSHLPFLDIDIYRRPDGSMGHSVYKKPTHTDLYLNVESHHHPTNKHPVLSILIHRARAICYQESLPGELEFLRSAFK